MKTHNIKLDKMVEFLGLCFHFVYDMGSTQTFELTVEEVLKRESFSKAYGYAELPAVV